jgi:hypothetical protein
MSTHDDESAPLDDMQAGDEAGQVESGEPLSAASEDLPAPGGESITAALERQLHAIRSAMEQKDWQGVADALGLETVSIEGHPESVAAIVSRLYPLTTNLCDFEGVLLRVSKHDVEENRARFSFRFRIMWNSSDDWEDHDLYVDAHIGYNRDEQGWKAAYLSLSRAYPASEQPVKPAAPAPEAAPREAPRAAVPKSAAPVVPAKRPAPTVAKVKRPAVKAPVRAAGPPSPAPPQPKAADQRLTDEYFSQAAAQYFAQIAGGAPGETGDKKSQGLASSVGGKHHLLYVPVVMHEDLIKKILGND